MAMKHVRSRKIVEHLESMADVIRDLVELDARYYIMTILRYIFEKSEIHDVEWFKNFIRTTLPKSMEEEAMTLAQIFKQEGRQEGRREGVQEGRQQTMEALELLKNGVASNEVAEITGVEYEEVMRLEQYIQH